MELTTTTRPTCVARRAAPVAWSLGLSVCLAACLVSCGGGAGGPTAAGGTPSATEANAVVRRVVDGDTIVADVDGRDERVRLIGIDTPETKKPDTPVECFGPEASARLHDLLPDGTPVRLERDVEERDSYGRLLAYVRRAADGTFVNEAMVAEGYAAQLTIPPNVAHAERFTAAVRRAREQRLGLWDSCPGPHAARGP